MVGNEISKPYLKKSPVPNSPAVCRAAAPWVQQSWAQGSWCCWLVCAQHPPPVSHEHGWTWWPRHHRWAKHSFNSKTNIWLFLSWDTRCSGLIVTDHVSPHPKFLLGCWSIPLSNSLKTWCDLQSLFQATAAHEPTPVHCDAGFVLGFLASIFLHCILMK